ncbi:competence type IV pilus minor pilin ComGF [Thalassobacillus pellis]|uniref:competence type IV pilus minor pilin ComGF n=1 Tax=Thalassobacillus pellis TaxID=748008 RepID=UPI00195F4758|nr:competence type IV pilus minor pilin ComGF [Thalassobacillus pellis]MBM7552301.1 competence protein ComGF [Thalassobacillus pellis]
MKRKKESNYAYMDTKKCDGYTLIESLLCLTMVSILFTFLLPIYKLMDLHDYEEELDIQQFFTFLEEEISYNSITDIKPNAVSFTSNTGENITIEFYQGSVRRTVDGSGHEILIHSVQGINFTLSGSLFTATVTSKAGEEYEKKSIVKNNIP